jgi:hypothetical protein
MVQTLEPDVLVDEILAAGDPDDAVPAPPDATDEGAIDAPVSLRPVLASGLATAAAALVVGGLFSSWGARLFGLLVAVGGTLLAAWALRSKRPALAQGAALVAIGVAALFSVLPGASPGDIRRLLGDAVDSARLLQLPIPFDPGWRPILTVALGFLGFGAAWVGGAMRRPLLGVVLPIPLVALAAISQPSSEQVIGGVFAFLPILAAFGVLFGGDAGADQQSLGRQFELARVARATAGMVAIGVLLVAIGRADFLFPKPAYDPNDRPQKPRSIPLSQQRDRILLKVQVPPGFTGPWRTNVLDTYDAGAWKLPGTSAARFARVPADGALVTDLVQAAVLEVTITTDDLGPTAVLPMVPTAQRVELPAGHPDLQLDTRAGTLRVPTGRAPSGFTYKVHLPTYATAKELGAVPKVTGDPVFLAVPPAPVPIQRLLAQAPLGPWERLDFVRKKLLEGVTASGAGTPQEITPARVVDLLEGSKKGTPYEIVAAQALLARWAGIPSRIGVGFNGVNDEAGTLTVRPKNAAQWLEVRFDGYGWLPLLDVPPQAQADLENKDEANDRVLPSTDVAVQVYVPVELSNPRLLFERVRAVLLRVLPIVALLGLAYLAAPTIARAVRRRRRERWADALGPRARVAVAYTELRDAATDLSVGDPFATPIEYLDAVEEDAEHRELAWLVTRAMYGDLALEVSEDDARLAEEMASSLARRLGQAQPLQIRAVAWLSRASIVRPFSDEVPNVTVPTPLRSLRLGLRRLIRRAPAAEVVA